MNAILPFPTDFYDVVRKSWPICKLPKQGQIILASYTNDYIIVYQAFKNEIADWAVENQTFLHCPFYKTDRMTWIKTNFLWMMFRSGWASKINQERILAIKISIEGWLEILRQANVKDVRLQWDPDHFPDGTKVNGRRAIQLGIKNDILDKFLKNWIISIHDITQFVIEQRQIIQSKNFQDPCSNLKIPIEKIFNVEDHEIRQRISLEDT